MDVGTVVGDAVLTSGTVVASVIAAVAARRSGQAHKAGQENAVRLDEIKRQTDGRLDERIQAAVRTVADEHPGLITNAVASEAIRELLDAFLRAAMDDPDSRRRPPHRREEER